MSDDRCQFCYCRAVNPFGVDGGYTCSDCMAKYMDRVELPDTGKIIATLTRERDQLKARVAELEKDRASIDAGRYAMTETAARLRARAEKAEGDARWFVKNGCVSFLMLAEWEDRAKPYEEKQ